MRTVGREKVKNEVGPALDGFWGGVEKGALLLQTSTWQKRNNGRSRGDLSTGRGSCCRDAQLAPLHMLIHSAASLGSYLGVRTAFSFPRLTPSHHSLWREEHCSLLLRILETQRPQVTCPSHTASEDQSGVSPRDDSKPSVFPVTLRPTKLSATNSTSKRKENEIFFF